MMKFRDMLTASSLRPNGIRLEETILLGSNLQTVTRISKFRYVFPGDIIKI